MADESKGKPTPTQEENDRAAMGEHVVNKEPDGSGEEPNQPTQHTRQSEANKPGGGDYQTRAGKAAQQPPQRPAPPPPRSE